MLLNSVAATDTKYTRYERQSFALTGILPCRFQLVLGGSLLLTHMGILLLVQAEMSLK